MRRATPPTEILLGFFVGMIATLCVELPLVWFLHLLHLTPRTGFSLQPVAPMGVEAMWSRVFWGGAFGLALAGWGVFYPIGVRWLISSAGTILAARLFVDWIIAPMWSATSHVWGGWSVDAVVMPLVMNVAWVLATALLLAAATLAAGTWGTKSLT
ncbi:MAG TPA: hypothetical protein VFA27_08090 [Vicinamibacterales bacterium]|nr:hypothetical protein [Vicinamibacterales bacterium]